MGTTVIKSNQSALDLGMVWIPGGTFNMGSDHHYPEEAPAHSATVEGFWIDKHAITNEQFARFVEATKHVTVAERPPKAEDYPGALPEMLSPASMVVHIAHEDAEAYARWAGKELPTEAEWEFAARGGLDGTTYAWGEEFTPAGKQMANTWQGEFPWQNLLTDGYERTAPVGQFPANGYGLFDMIGNVWEWTTDWYADRHDSIKSCCGGLSPKTADREQSYDRKCPASTFRAR